MSMPFRAVLAPVTLIVLTWMSPALAMRTIDFAEYRLPEEGAIAVPVEEAEQLTGVAAAVNEATGGSLAAALAEAGFTGKVGDALTLFGVRPYARIDLVGIGTGALDRVAAEQFGGRVAALNDGSSGTQLKVLWHSLDREPESDAARVALGFLLGDYRFDRYQEERVDTGARGKVVVLSDDASAASKFFWLASSLVRTM